MAFFKRSVPALCVLMLRAIQNNPELALLPTELGMLAGLTELLLADSNELSVLPTEIGMLDKHLRSLYVDTVVCVCAHSSNQMFLRFAFPCSAVLLRCLTLA